MILEIKGNDRIVSMTLKGHLTDMAREAHNIANAILSSSGRWQFTDVSLISTTDVDSETRWRVTAQLKTLKTEPLRF